MWNVFDLCAPCLPTAMDKTISAKCRATHAHGTNFSRHACCPGASSKRVEMGSRFPAQTRGVADSLGMAAAVTGPPLDMLWGHQQVSFMELALDFEAFAGQPLLAALEDQHWGGELSPQETGIILWLDVALRGRAWGRSPYCQPGSSAAAPHWSRWGWVQWWESTAGRFLLERRQSGATCTEWGSSTR